MSDSIASGLYRTTMPLPKNADIPADVLVYVGNRPDESRFVVRPYVNRRNRWYWREPVVTVADTAWLATLRRLRPEGYYLLPETIEVGEGRRWLEHSIVQLGYNGAGRAILFIAEDHAGEPRNVLEFARSGRIIEDTLLDRLVWAPVRLVTAPPAAPGAPGPGSDELN